MHKIDGCRIAALCQHSAAQRQHRRIAVQADQPAGRADFVQDQPGMTTRADGRIDNDLAWSRIEKFENFGRQNGNVRGHRNYLAAGSKEED